MVLSRRIGEELGSTARYPGDVAMASEPNTDLAQAIERQIAQRTWGRIHRLKVEAADGRIVVNGCTQSYHSKQLALEAVRDVIGDCAHLDLDIHVGTWRPGSIQLHACRQGRPPSAAG